MGLGSSHDSRVPPLKASSGGVGVKEGVLVSRIFFVRSGGLANETFENFKEIAVYVGCLLRGRSRLLPWRDGVERPKAVVGMSSA